MNDFKGRYEALVDTGHLVGGQQVPGRSGRTSPVLGPTTGEVIANVALTSREQLNDGGRPRWTSGARSGAEFVIPTMK